VLIALRSNDSGNRIIITAKIFHCRMKHTISPEKRHTEPADHCVSYTYKYDKQSNNTIKSITVTTMQTNQITLDLFIVYPTHRLKFAPLNAI